VSLLLLSVVSSLTMTVMRMMSILTSFLCFLLFSFIYSLLFISFFFSDYTLVAIALPIGTEIRGHRNAGRVMILDSKGGKDLGEAEDVFATIKNEDHVEEVMRKHLCT
jgi:hypothetical protein